MTSTSIYCVYLTLYRGNKLPPFYIGSSSVKKINSGYTGSVSSKLYKSVWKAENKLNPDLFVVKIISTHATRKEALEAEDQLQRKLDVIKNPLYVNMAYASGCFGEIQGDHPRKGVVVKGTETALKISKAKTGRKMSEEARIQHGLARSGEKHWNYGNVVPTSTKSKISESLKERNKTVSNVRLFKEYTINEGSLIIQHIVGDICLLHDKTNIKLSGLKWHATYMPETSLYKKRFLVSHKRTFL